MARFPRFETREVLLRYCVAVAIAMVTLVVGRDAPSASAQGAAPIPGSAARIDTAASSVERQLLQIDALIAAEAWEEAIDGIERLLDEAPHDLVAISSDRWIPVREACHGRIARWPAEPLAIYRARVDAGARARLERGISQRSEEDLQLVIDEYFCSNSGDDALLWLGDLALERGDTTAARGYWQQISPTLSAPDGRPWGIALAGIDLENAECAALVARQFASPTVHADQLTYPGSDLRLPEILARLTVASHIDGNRRRAAIEAALLRTYFPNAVGYIGGRETELATTVADLLASNGDAKFSVPPTGWQTFGGDNCRGLVAGPVGDLACVVWQSSIAPRPRLAVAPWDATTMASGTVDFVQPVVTDKAVAFLTDDGLNALNLADGKPLFGDHPTIFREVTGERIRDALQPSGGVIRLGEQVLINPPVRGVQARIEINGGILRQNIQAPFAQFLDPNWGIAPSLPERGRMLALGGSVAYACLGPRATNGNTPADADSVSPAVRGLDLAAEGRLCMEVPLDENWRSSGPVVVDRDRVYVPQYNGASGGLLRLSCHGRSTGRRIWQTPLASGIDIAGATSHVLTLGAGKLYVGTNAGLIVAIDAANGQIAWARKYRRGVTSYPADVTALRQRPAGPCLLADGLLVCAPPDAAAVFALDPTTGQTLWVQPAIADVADLLGVIDSSLVATGQQLWLLDLHTGRPRFAWPESLLAGIRGSGRGCIAGDEVFWPTTDAIHAINAHTGQPTRSPIPLAEIGGAEGANLIPLGKGLLVATHHRILLLGAERPRDDQAPPTPEIVTGIAGAPGTASPLQ